MLFINHFFIVVTTILDLWLFLSLINHFLSVEKCSEPFSFIDIHLLFFCFSLEFLHISFNCPIMSFLYFSRNTCRTWFLLSCFNHHLINLFSKLIFKSNDLRINLRISFSFQFQLLWFLILRLRLNHIINFRLHLKRFLS